MQFNKRCFYIYTVLQLFGSSVMIAQVPVRDEPRHHPVLQNKYIRLLDVWLPPGDTTLYHIHSTPSLFVILSKTVTGSQIKGEEWVKGESVPGSTWYRSFTPDSLVHRVCNMDTIVFHVNDIEILSAYNSINISRKPLSFPVLFENEKAFAYQLTGASFNRQIIKDRGPIIAELVTGMNVFFHDTKKQHPKKVSAGNYVYIAPGTSFYFTGGNEETKMVLFEIK